MSAWLVGGECLFKAESKKLSILTHTESQCVQITTVPPKYCITRQIYMISHHGSNCTPHICAHTNIQPNVSSSPVRKSFHIRCLTCHVLNTYTKLCSTPELVPVTESELGMCPHTLVQRSLLSQNCVRFECKILTNLKIVVNKPAYATPKLLLQCAVVCCACCQPSTPQPTTPCTHAHNQLISIQVIVRM